MYRITDAQIDFMLDDFRARGITRDSLQQDLLDHVCCIIEQELEETGDFGRCYTAAIATFYNEELAEIEAETMLLTTFKNYYAMRKTMIVSGTLSAGAFITGSLFKLFQLPGAGYLLVAGILLFSFLFLPLMLVIKVKEMPAIRDKLILAIATLTGALYCLSMLFLLEHWPGARVLWLATLMLAFLVFIPAYFFTGIRRAETKFNTIVSTIMLVAVIGIQFMLTALYAS